MSRTTITMDETLQEEAKELDLNVSEICREAVRHVIANAKEARKHGKDFETVQARMGDFDLAEDVEFHGRHIHTDHETLTDFYITAGGNVATVDDEGFLEYGDLESLDLPGVVRQVVEEALGQAVTPTFLDI
jgi:hypothetical protein